MNEADRRVKRTRRSLGEALVALAKEKEYDEITIQEITDRADVGYRTFFRHYDDKDALLLDVLQATMDEVHQLLTRPTAADLASPEFMTMPAENGRIIFQHVRENNELYRLLLKSGPVAMGPVQAIACRQIQGSFAVIPDSPIPQEIVANHVVSAVFSLIRWWLDNDMPYRPKEMGEYMARLIMLPTWQAISGRIAIH
jgi:AcrR family transcriptional regulator